MATVPEQIEAALFTHVLGLSVTGDPPVAWPNIPFPDEGDDKPDTFVAVRHFPNNNTRLMMRGGDPHMRQGILQFTIYTPLNEGYETATTIAGEIADHFPADLNLYEDDVRVRIQQAPNIMGAEVTDDLVSWSSRVDVMYECYK